MSDQARVLTHYDTGRCAVLAAPGAGKTTLISHLIAHWVEQRGISPTHILVLTFTDSAAQEFEKRTRQLLKRPFPVPEFSTIHAFCWRLLRRFDAGYTDREILSEERQYTILDQLVQAYGIENQGFDYIPLLCNTLIPGWRHQPERLKNWEAYRADMSPEQIRLWPRLLEVATAYEDLLAQENVLDYDAMITHTLNLLRRNPHLHQQLQHRYPYVIEDEAQDSSLIQGELLDVLTTGSNWLRVGDPNQSIYAFGGADHHQLADFANTYTFYPLRESNRATPNLIALCNRFHSQFKTAFPSPVMLAPGGKNPEDGWIWVRHYATIQAELQDIAKAAHTILKQNQSVAVLCRTHAGCERIANWLEQQQVPVIRHQERDNNLLMSEMALYLESLLAFLLQPEFNPLQTLCWRSGLSRQSMQQLFSVDQAIGPILQQLAQRKRFHGHLGTEEYAQWVQFASTLLFLLEHLYYPPLWVIESAIARLLPDSQQEVKARLLLHLWHHSDSQQGQLTDFQHWLTQARKRKIRQLLPQDESELSLTDPGVVHVLTTHKAKGLEWDGVILPFFGYEGRESGAETEWRALLRALQQQTPYQTQWEQLSKTEQDENLRLAYVGLSRARRYLMVSASAERQRNLGINSKHPSPVLQVLLDARHNR